jgi:hypothetical protein
MAPPSVAQTRYPEHQTAYGTDPGAPGNTRHPDRLYRISAEHDRGGVTISLVGEFDMAGTTPFWAFVTDAIAADPRAVTVDARGARVH